jgi:hypothetical protein
VGENLTVPMTRRRDHRERNMQWEHAGTDLLLFIETQSLNANPQIVELVPNQFGKEAELQMSSQSQLETSAHAERHYAVAEIAEMWNLSADKVRNLFEHEPGVLVIEEQQPSHKRRYITLRIPQSVVERVHLRLSSKMVVR